AGAPIDPPGGVPDDPREEARPDEVHAERDPQEAGRGRGAEAADQVPEHGEDEEQVRPEQEGGGDPQEAFRGGPEWPCEAPPQEVEKGLPKGPELPLRAEVVEVVEVPHCEPKGRPP